MDFPYYELNCGQPVLHKGGVPVGPPLDEIAIAFDASEERIVLHKHGNSELVQKWVDASKQKLMAAGKVGIEMAAALEMVRIPAFPPGSLPLEDVNSAIQGNQLALQRLVRSGDVLNVEAREVFDLHRERGE